MLNKVGILTINQAEVDSLQSKTWKFPHRNLKAKVFHNVYLRQSVRQSSRRKGSNCVKIQKLKGHKVRTEEIITCFHT